MISRMWSVHSADDHLIHRPVHVTLCTRCSRHILIGIVHGWDTCTDLESLTIQAEITALITRRITYDLVPKGNGRYLIDRDIYRIRAPREYPVLINHICPDGREPSIAWRIPENKPSANPRPKPAPGNSPVPF